MFDIIRMFLFTIGLLKLTSIEDKIKYIKYRRVVIYNSNFIHKMYKVSHKDIMKDVEYLNNILEADHTKYNNCFVTGITYKLYGSDWLSSDGYMLENTQEIFTTWLNKYMEVHKLYNKYVNDLSSGRSYSNMKKMKTYIINTEYIVESIFENTYNPK